MSNCDKQIKTDFEIKSYRDFQRFIKGHTSKSLHKLYDDLYFRKHVGNKEISEVYFKNLGLAQTKYTKIPLEIARIQPKDKVIDIGCGRGEIVFQAASKGANVTGIDFSESAIKIACNIREKHKEDIKSRTEFFCCNAEKLKFKDNFFDKAFFLDVVEHLSKSELRTVLCEIRRVLKPEGILIIHTSPNVWSRNYGYWLKSFALLLLKRKKPVHPIVEQFKMLKSDPEYDEYKLILHINEQSILSLKQNLKKCGFKSIVWLENTGNRWSSRKDFKGRMLSFIYKLSGLKYIFGSEIFAVASLQKAYQQK